MSWLRTWRRRVRSTSRAGYASGLYGRSLKLCEMGQKVEALDAARKGLAALDGSEVDRRWPAVSSTLLSLTIQVERLAQELGADGASWKDVMESAALLRTLPASGDVTGEIRRCWLPYFEAKVEGGRVELGNEKP
jgi:hypothetical protein